VDTGGGQYGHAVSRDRLAQEPALKGARSCSGPFQLPSVSSSSRRSRRAPRQRSGRASPWGRGWIPLDSRA